MLICFKYKNNINTRNTYNQLVNATSRLTYGLGSFFEDVFKKYEIMSRTIYII